MTYLCFFEPIQSFKNGMGPTDTGQQAPGSGQCLLCQDVSEEMDNASPCGMQSIV